MPPRRRDAGFTIVELLIVIAIIALLVGMLLPALGGAQRRSLKARELNGLRQVAQAWNLYASRNNGYVMPGYLSTAVQERWRARYRFPDGSLVPPAPDFLSTAPNLAGPWTYRLLPQLNYDHATVHGYAAEPGFDIANLGRDESGVIYDLDEATEIAEEPSFGYNAFYVGGWWDVFPVAGGMVDRPTWFDAVPEGAAYETGPTLSVVRQSIGSIRRSSELIVFCSSARLSEGGYRGLRDDVPGCHYVVPPLLAGDPQWGVLDTGAGAGAIDPDATVVHTDTAAPIARYNPQIAVMYADGHTDGQTLVSLMDMRKWIDVADRRDWTHEPGMIPSSMPE